MIDSLHEVVDQAIGTVRRFNQGSFTKDVPTYAEELNVDGPTGERSERTRSPVDVAFRTQTFRLAGGSYQTTIIVPSTYSCSATTVSKFVH